MIELKRIINQFKEPIYKDDLKRVLLYCFLNTLLFSILAGAIQYFANITLGFLEFSILIYMIAYMIGKELKDKVFTYHILYSVLGVVFFIVGYFIYHFTIILFSFKNLSVTLQFFFSNIGLSITVFKIFNLNLYLGIGIFYNIIDILVIVFSILTVWRMSTYRK